MTEPTKEDQIKAAVLAVRTLLYPDIKALLSQPANQRAVLEELNGALVSAIGKILSELMEAELNGQ